MWALILSAVRGMVCFLNQNPLEGLCLVNPSPYKAKLIQVAFLCYYGLRNNYKGEVQQVQDSGCFDVVHTILPELASEHFRAN